MRILIAEDDLILRELLTEWARAFGYEAVAVQNGRAALAAVASQPPTLLLCDIGLPGLNGFEVCRRLKADPATRQIPVLLITGIGEEYRHAGIEAGADDFLNKPFPPAELRARIQALLGGHRPIAAGTTSASTAQRDRRRLPRHLTRHQVEGASLDPPISFRGLLRDLSAAGCNLCLDARIPPGVMVEAVCNVSGLGLRLYGAVVWIEETPAGILHGVGLTGFPSNEDALFHRLYVGRLARRAEGVV